MTTFCSVRNSRQRRRCRELSAATSIKFQWKSKEKIISLFLKKLFYTNQFLKPNVLEQHDKAGDLFNHQNFLTLLFTVADLNITHVDFPKTFTMDISK